MRQLRIAIPFTPHTPHAKRITVLLLILFMPISTILLAQKANTVNLDSLGTYEASYRAFMVQK